MAVHDVEALLPLADEVAVMDGGRVREVLPAAVYARQLALAAGTAAPQALRAAALAGAEPQGGALWPSPRELARQLAAKPPGAAGDHERSNGRSGMTGAHVPVSPSAADSVKFGRKRPRSA